MRPGAERLVRALWRDRRSAVGFVAIVGVLSGSVMALAMPRGPVTAAQALMLMSTGALVGVTAGVVLRSRWAMLLAPVAHVVAFELGRVGAHGPTVDAIHVDTTYGILAFLLGRGFYGLVGLLPMIVGVAYGAALARRALLGPAQPRGRRRLGLYTRRAITALTAVGLVALAVLIARPASTPPILAANGKALPGSVSTLQKLRLGGHDQWVLMRGYSVDKPVLLYLSGGPGQSDLPYSRVFFNDLAKRFVVVGCDQRGAGKSYPALDQPTLTLKQAIGDTIELTNYLRRRFGERKIYLMGESWGTILGLLAVQRHPGLFYAYIASGQMVNPRETDQRLYRDVLSLAARTHDRGLATKMRSYGPPPWKDVWAYSVVFQQYDKLAGEFTKPKAYEDLGSASGLGFMGIGGQEYNLVEKVNVLRGVLDMFATMYPQLQRMDFRRSAENLQVPCTCSTAATSSPPAAPSRSTDTSTCKPHGSASTRSPTPITPPPSRSSNRSRGS